MKQVVQNKTPKKQSLEKYFGVVVLIIIFASAAKAMHSYQESIEQKYGAQELSSTPTPEPMSEPTPYVFASPYPTASPTAKPLGVKKNTQAVLDSDPPVHCQISSKCGGGTTPLKKSECDNMICCVSPNGARFVPKQECNGGMGSATAPSGTSPINKYPDCTVYYPGLKMSQTYSGFAPEYCLSVQQQANRNPNATTQPNTLIPPHEQPSSTADPALREECKQNAVKLRDVKYEYCRTTDWNDSSEEMICISAAKAEWEKNEYSCNTLN